MSYDFNFEKSRIIDSFENLSLLSSVEQEDMSLSEYFNPGVSGGASCDDSRVNISFCIFSLSSKTNELGAVEKSHVYFNPWVSSGVVDIFLKYRIQK